MPLTRLAELAAYGSVHRIGDGEETTSPAVSEARVTISAEAADLRLPGGTSLSGSGINVAILDDGIENPALTPETNPIVTKSQYCAEATGCRDQTQADLTRIHNGTRIPNHGTAVASVVSTAGEGVRAGIAQGVRIFDVNIFPQPDAAGEALASRTAFANGLDWAHANGAHVANLSFGDSRCSTGSAIAMIANEAADKGMVVVGVAGNDGFDGSLIDYATVGSHNCATNPITVGGVNDTGTTLRMYQDSSRGPALPGRSEANALLKPDLAAPAAGISVLTTHNTLTTANRGARA